MNRGTCIDTPTAFSCVCRPGFSGPLCETDVDECLSFPCRNEGRCAESVPGEFACTCPRKYTGLRCETEVFDCRAYPCLNSGSCVPDGSSFRCLCPAGVTGENCTTAVNECDSSPCLNGGTCRDFSARFSCVCPVGTFSPVCTLCPTVENCRIVECTSMSASRCGTCFVGFTAGSSGVCGPATISAEDANESVTLVVAMSARELDRQRVYVEAWVIESVWSFCIGTNPPNSMCANFMHEKLSARIVSVRSVQARRRDSAASSLDVTVSVTHAESPVEFSLINSAILGAQASFQSLFNSTLSSVRQATSSEEAPSTSASSSSPVIAVVAALLGGLILVLIVVFVLFRRKQSRDQPIRRRDSQRSSLAPIAYSTVEEKSEQETQKRDVMEMTTLNWHPKEHTYDSASPAPQVTPQVMARDYETPIKFREKNDTPKPNEEPTNAMDHAFGVLDRAEAESILKVYGVGSYLLRVSPNDIAGGCVLTIHFRKGITHNRIRLENGTFFLGGTSEWPFPSIDALLQHFHRHPFPQTSEYLLSMISSGSGNVSIS
jgi:hypothetical protein